MRAVHPNTGSKQMDPQRIALCWRTVITPCPKRLPRPCCITGESTVACAAPTFGCTQCTGQWKTSLGSSQNWCQQPWREPILRWLTTRFPETLCTWMTCARLLYEQQHTCHFSCMATRSTWVQEFPPRLGSWQISLEVFSASTQNLRSLPCPTGLGISMESGEPTQTKRSRV